MWDRFNSEAHAAIDSASQEALKLGLSTVSAEHLLLGVIRDSSSVAARILAEMGITVSRVRVGVERWLDRGSGRYAEVTLAPRARRVLELAIDEAERQGRPHAGTGHILAGVVREGGSLGAKVLDEFGVDLDRMRDAAGKWEQDESDGDIRN